jgi:hypothetical protein
MIEGCIGTASGEGICIYQSNQSSVQKYSSFSNKQGIVAHREQQRQKITCVMCLVELAPELTTAGRRLADHADE